MRQNSLSDGFSLSNEAQQETPDGVFAPVGIWVGQPMLVNEWKVIDPDGGRTIRETLKEEAL